MVSRVMKDLEARGFIQTLPSGAMVLKTAWRHSADPHPGALRRQGAMG